MPSHRKASTPRHRVQRRTGESARRTRLSAALSAAVSAAKQALPISRSDDSQDVPRRARRLLSGRLRRLGLPARTRLRQFGPHPRTRLGRSVKPVALGPPDRRPTTLRGAARGAARTLLVTPWFAAGAGFVLAAGLWIYSPHTELRFPSNATAPATVPCTTPGCVTAKGQPNGQLAVTTPGVRIKHPRKGQDRNGQSNAAGQHTAISGLTFTFTTLWHQDGKFGGLIKVSGKDLPSSWQLTFAIPGARIEYVLGAQWQPASSGGGGTATGTQNQSGQDGGQGDRQGQDSDQDQGNSLSFMIMASGTPGTPTSCVFNGARCAFS